MKKSILTAAFFCLAIGIGTQVNGSTGLQAPAGPIILGGKKPATFDHATHDKPGLTCGACHHNAGRESLSAVQIAAMANGADLACSKCHHEGFKNPKLQKRMDLFHAACRECHQQGVGDLKGPTRCNDCHVSR